jgi:DNA-binding transcriptional MerR regulator
MPGLAIGQLAKAAATKVQTIRYYEEIGLMSPFERTEGGHRVYGPEHSRRLKFIRHARELGFGIDEIRELLKLSDNPAMSCSSADRIASGHLAQVELRITKLRALRKELKRMVEECAHDRVSQCRVIEVLSDHAHCHGDH